MPQPASGLMGGMPMPTFGAGGPAAQAWASMQSGQPYAAPSGLFAGMPTMAQMAPMQQMLQGAPTSMPQQMAAGQQMLQGASGGMSPQILALLRMLQGAPQGASTLAPQGRTY